MISFSIDSLGLFIAFAGVIVILGLLCIYGPLDGDRWRK